MRPGNPKGIRDWDDLKRLGLQVLTPNPKTSGGAMWNVVAIYGAVVRGKAGPPAGDPAVAEDFLRRIAGNVAIMDKGARESMVTFESGVGDAAITYENEVLVARKAGKAMDHVVPRSTVLIENPAAVVDLYADRRGTRDLAEGFVQFLVTAEAQKAYAAYGLRPVDENLVTDTAALPPVEDLFTIADLGGWPRVTEDLFSQRGLWPRATERMAIRR